MEKTAVTKYWFFNGEDVIGPLSPQQLASRLDFLATSLICPEHASVKADSWQPAYQFAEFHFDEITGKLALVNASETAATPAKRLRKRSKKPAKPIATEFIRLSKINKKEAAPTPIVLAKGASVDLVLPEQPSVQEDNTPTEQAAPTDSAVTPTAQPSPVQTENASQPPAAAEEEDKSSCVLPIVPERISEENLPFLPEGDGTCTEFVAEPDFGPEEDEEVAEPREQETQAVTPLPAQPEPVQPVVLATEPAEKKQVNDIPEEKEEFIEPKVSQIKARLVPTPEIEEFLTDHRFGMAPQRKGHPELALAFLMVLLVPGIIFLLLQSGCLSLKATATPAEAAVLGAPEKEVAAELIQPQTELLPPPAEPAPVAASVKSADEEKALKAVQNHILPANRGTISSYFARLYQERLAQGYTASWSAEPLHNSTYIVKYRVAKTRAEPIVYVFQADAKKNQLTGALNNAALDLVGRI
ncbi:MAG: hypothetical protein IKP06_02090 [Elusimicrobiaceae bacterium]|nr:hypothetical protein [Elusimicrobiaceae bacterium]